MKIKTPLTKQRLRTHFTYHLWKYLLAAALTVFCVNLLYTTTAYRSPENLRVDIYMQSTTAMQEKVDAFMKDVWQRSVPDMETVNTILLTAGSTDDYYSNMQLSVYLMAGEGDLYALSTEDFKRFAAQGVFIDLTPYVESGALNVEDIDLSSGYVTLLDDDGNPTETKSLFGIPLYTLYGYMDGMGLDNRDLVIGVTTFNQNEENVIAFLNELIQSGKGDMPERLKQ